MNRTMVQTLPTEKMRKAYCLIEVFLSFEVDFLMWKFYNENVCEK